MAYKIPSKKLKEKQTYAVDNQKVDYFQVDGNEMMRDDFNHFVEFLKENNDEITAYQTDKGDVILEVKRKKAYSSEDLKKEDKFQKELGSWLYYHPVNFLYHKPSSVSDYDEIEL